MTTNSNPAEGKGGGNVEMGVQVNAARERPEAGPLRRALWNDTVQTIVYAILIAIAVRIVAFEPFNIPSGSMYPTLMVGDYLFVSKYSYGYSRHSFPWSIPPFEGRIFEGSPERGDVVVFKEPRGNSTDYIKRVIGLPGDTIQVVGGVLYVNGEGVERRRIEDYVWEDGRRSVQYVEVLPNGRTHRILEEEGDLGSNDDTQIYAVPPAHYFMMGDNRDNSSDSRVIGPVPSENLIGRAEILFYSHDGTARWWQVWKWPFAMRFGRFFNSVE